VNTQRNFELDRAGSADAEVASTEAMLRESVLAFVRAHDGRVSRTCRNVKPGYDPRLLTEMADLGWLGLLVPEDFGGSGLGFRAMAAVLQHTSASLIAEPITACAVLAGGVLARLKGSGLTRKLLAGQVSGADLSALAWQEAPATQEVLPTGTILTRTAAGYVLNGQKSFVAGAGAVSGLIVTCRQSETLTLVWVPWGDIQTNLQWRTDGAPFVNAVLSDVAITAGQVLASGEEALQPVTCALLEATVMICAELVGISEKALSMTLDHMNSRVQYGQPIGSFQALQHRAVDLFVQLELSKSVLDEAATALDNGARGLEMQCLASRAKARCSDTALRITREAVQLHGAIGYTDELDLGLYLKRALVLSAWLGNSRHHRELYSELRKTNNLLS
jgi:alkylation response protein AidB-like acyl-CoA dehydrogenase